MSVQTLRPNSATFVGSPPLTASAPPFIACLVDDSDATYVTGSFGGQAMVSHPALAALPAGAVISRYRIRVRQSRAGAPGALVLSTFVDAAQVSSEGFGSTSAITTITGAWREGPWTTAQINTITTQFGSSGPAFDVRFYELYLDVQYVVLPAVVVTKPDGAITTTNLPVVRWVNTLDASGGPQTNYEIKYFTAAQYGAGGFNPATSTPFAGTGIIGSNNSHHNSETPLPDGTYRAYVRTAQAVNGAADRGVFHWSPWEYSGFTVSVALPGVPLLTATAEPGSGRIRLNVTPQSGAATTDALEVQRSIDGATWLPVRTPGGLGALILGAGAATVRDYESPNGREIAYRARALHNYGGLYAVGGWSNAVFGQWNSEVWWLKHPLLPMFNRPVTLKSYGAVSGGARQGIFQPLGAALAIITSDTPLSLTGQITVRTDTLGEWQRLARILATGSPLLLQGPYGAEPDRYVSFGSWSSGRLIENVRFSQRDTPISWTTVAQPAGGVGEDYNDMEELIVL